MIIALPSVTTLVVDAHLNGKVYAHLWTHTETIYTPLLIGAWTNKGWRIHDNYGRRSKNIDQKT